MAYYGLQADVQTNPDKNVLLYVPEKTKLTPQDVFLGGPGTGVSDEMIGQATRVFGEDRAGTRRALGNYEGDLASQTKSVIAQNAAPRSDAYMGMPTLARQQMEAGQAQDKISNDQGAAQLMGSLYGSPTLAQKTFEHGVTQDAFTNEYNVGNMMGNYLGKTTLEQRRSDIQEAQYKSTLASNNYNNAEDRKISQQNANTSELSAGITGASGTVSGGTMPQEYSGWVNDAAAQNGIPPAILAGLIEAESSWDTNAVNPTSGATGLGQFLASTARDEGLTNSTDAQSNIYATAAYLAKRISWAGGDLNKGIMGYGEGTTAYLNRVLDKSKNYTTSAGTKTMSDAGLTVTERNYLDKQDVGAANDKAFSILNELANDGKSRTEILNYLNKNFTTMEGADYDTVLTRAKNAFTWDKDTGGNWYNTWVNKTPE